ncbi:MAG: GNAT family N-acetyltransferase, partial [Pseudohongiellaceae bacterium]
VEAKARELHVSGWHILFPQAQASTVLAENGLMQRSGCQYQWFNHSFRDFDHYLEKLSSRKRKNIRKERAQVADAGIHFEVLEGPQVSPDLWQTYYDFYRSTYFVRGRHPYLNLSFFQRIGRVMPEALVLVMALRDEEYIAGALSFKGADTLYGRYWGCLEEYRFLHFETCYYQGIDYCIRQSLARFDSGAQGEHKIQRGFEPVLTCSNHWIADPRFSQAIARFLEEEESYITEYLQRAQNYLPFKKTGLEISE